MIVAIANQKGGVGKTTTSINLAASFALKGMQVLLIDLDPQGNSSLSFLDSRQIENGAFELFTDSNASWDSLCYSTHVENLAIVPAKVNLAKLEAALSGDFDAAFRLRDLLSEVRKEFDIILFDTPPALGLITVNALVAADFVLIPIQSSYFALEGADDLLETVEKVRKRLNPDLSILGVLVTLFDQRTSISKDVAAHIRKVFGGKTFETVISRSVRLEEAPANKQPIFSYSPKSSGAFEYAELTEEVLKRI